MLKTLIGASRPCCRSYAMAVKKTQDIPGGHYPGIQEVSQDHQIYECIVHMYSPNEYRGCVRSYSETILRMEEKTLDFARTKMHDDEILSHPQKRAISSYEPELIDMSCLMREKPYTVTECIPLVGL